MGNVILSSERIVTPKGVVAGAVGVEGERIVSVDAREAARSEVVDLGDRWLVPGYIDLHVHGGGGAQCSTAEPDDVAAMARFHAAHGTTALLPTTVAAPIADLITALGAIGEARSLSGGATVLGAHLEGPFLSPGRPGAMDPAMFLSPDPTVLAELLAAVPSLVAMMTLAPELPGALELVDALVDARVVASLGHSDASFPQTMAAIDRGARSATHTFNAMPPLHHRRPGILGAVLGSDQVSCELILDGVHVNPAVARLAYRVKGPAGVHLVTDAIQAAGMPDGEYRLGAAAVSVVQGRPTLPDGGSIAGSTLTMDAAVANAVSFLGVALPDAVTLASTNPARLLGMGERKGAIAPGWDADLVVLDDALRACATMVGGRWVHGAGASSGSR